MLYLHTTGCLCISLVGARSLSEPWWNIHLECKFHKKESAQVRILSRFTETANNCARLPTKRMSNPSHWLACECNILYSGWQNGRHNKVGSSTNSVKGESHYYMMDSPSNYIIHFISVNIIIYYSIFLIMLLIVSLSRKYSCLTCSFDSLMNFQFHCV